jgi:flagellar motor switch protein FliM
MTLPSYEKFDFRNAATVDRHVARPMQQWLENFSSIFAERWKSLSSTTIRIQQKPLRSDEFASATKQITSQSIGYPILLSDTKIPSLISISRSELLALLMEILGENLTEMPADRPLTANEFSLADCLFEEISVSIGESWLERTPLAIKLETADLQPHRSRLFAPKESVIKSFGSIHCAAGQANLFWILPRKPMETLLVPDRIKSPSEPASKQDLSQSIEQIPLEISIRLGEVELPMSRISELKPGDIIVLNQSISDPLTAEIEGGSIFQVRPGRVANRQAVKITRRTTSSSEFAK